MLSMNMPTGKMHYLFSGLDSLISGAIIDSLTKIPEINKNGVLKMCRNVFALQQNLSSIMALKEVHFDRARKYYKLLTLPEEDLRAHITETRALPVTDYSQHQYKALLKHLKRGNKKPRQAAKHKGGG